METVLLTGALGTLGRWTIDELAGDYEVVGVDRHRPRGPIPYDDVALLGADLTEQGPTREIVETVDPGALVHLAAIPGAGRRAGGETFLHNVASAYTVLDAAGREDVPVVWSSSEATYGVTFGEEARPLDRLPIDETHPQRPEDGYGLSKVVGETVAEWAVRRHGVPVTSIQPSWIQVPGAYETASVREGFSFEEPTPSGSLWSYVDVRDVARLLRLALEADAEGHERYLAAAAENYLGVPTESAIEAAWGELPEECDLEGEASAFSTEKARRELGWEPEHGWREAEGADVEGPAL